MENIPLPSTIEVQPIEGESHRSQVIVSPCYPGYGTTLGNALRRVLLSSLPGAAVTAIKIKGVDHEFSTIEGVKEDVVEIILNVKSLRFRSHSNEPVEIELTVSKEGVVTAKDFEKNSDVEVIDGDQVIATITDSSAEFHLKAVVEKGRGYVPVEERETGDLEVGYIAIDSIYTPVRMVNYKSEHVRVGQMTNFDKLVLDITTDGTITPEEAFNEAAHVLVEQFQVLAGGKTAAEEILVETTEEALVEEMPADEEEKED